MPKFTYPIVFILNDETGDYNGYIPDLGIFSHGEKLEDVYAEAEEIIHAYFKIATREELEFPTPTPLDEITAKWKGYKVSLLTANLPD